MKRNLPLLTIPAFFLICICIAILIHSIANPTDPADKTEPPFGDTVQEKHKTLQWKQFCGYEGTPYQFNIVPIWANDDGTVYSYDLTDDGTDLTDHDADLTDDDTERDPYIAKFPGVELQSYYNRSKNAKSESQNRCLRDMYHKFLTDDSFYSDTCLTNYYVQIHRTVGMLSFSIVHYSGEDTMPGKTSRRFCFNLDTENETGMSLYDMVSKQELREKAGMMLLEGISTQEDARSAEECLEQFFLQEDPEHDWYMTTEELCLIVHNTAKDGDTLLRIPFDRLSLKDCDEKTLQEELKPDRAAEFSYGGNQDYQLYFGFDKKATVRQESIKTELGPLTLRPYVLMSDSDYTGKINQMINDGIKDKFAHKDEYTKKVSNAVSPLTLRNTQDILSITYEWSCCSVEKNGWVSVIFQSYALNIDLAQIQKVNLYDLVTKEEIRKQAEEGNLTLTYGTFDLALYHPYAELMDSFLEWRDKQCYDDWYLTPDTYGTIHGLPKALASYAHLEFPREQGN